MTRLFWFRACTTALVAVLVVGVAACGGSTTSAGSKLGTVNIRLDADWDTLDPGTYSSIQGGQIIKGLYDNLVEATPSGTVKPYLATSWVVAPGIVTFTVRTDAVCADGTPVTSQVIANSFTRLFSPDLNSPQVGGGLGARPWAADAVDANHIKISVGNQSTQLLAVLADPYAGIVCPAGLLPGADFQNHSFGSGPYTLDSAIHGKAAVLKLRPAWHWGPPSTVTSALPQQIVFKVITDETTAANLVATGGLDVAGIQGQDISRLLNNSSLTVVKYQLLGVETAFFNERPGLPTTDPSVREALITAINRDDYAKAEGAFGTGASNLGSSTWFCYDKSVAALLPQPDLAKAKAILQSDGYVPGANGKLGKAGKPLTVILLAITTSGSGPDYLAAQWNQLGVDVVLHKLPRSGWLTDVLAGNYDVVQDTNVSPRGPDAPIGSALGAFYPHGPNVFGIDNVAAYQAITQEKTALTDGDRCSFWSQAQRLLFQNHDILPLAQNVNYFFTRNITFEPGADDEVDLTTLKHA